MIRNFVKQHINVDIAKYKISILSEPKISQEDRLGLVFSKTQAYRV